MKRRAFLGFIGLAPLAAAVKAPAEPVVFTETGTWHRPSGTKTVWVYPLVGGGGGGRGSYGGSVVDVPPPRTFTGDFPSGVGSSGRAY